MLKGPKPRRVTLDSNRENFDAPQNGRPRPQSASPGRDRSRHEAGGEQETRARRRAMAYFSCSATAAEGVRRPAMRGECGVVDGEGE